MTPTHTKKKVSFLSIALGSLVVTSLSTGSAEAGWSGPRCATQCSKTFVGNNEKKVNDCATNCKNINIMDTLRPNAALLNEANKKHFLDALKYQQSLQEKEHTKIEGQLKAETTKKKPSQSKIKDLNKKQDKFIEEINKLGAEIENLEKTLKAPGRPTTSLPEEKKAPERPTTPLPEEKKAPERPTHGPHLSQEGVNPSHSGAHISEPPSDMPPVYKEEATHEHPHSGAHSKPPSDMPPVYKDEPTPQASKGGNIPTPPKFGENPREILKADIQAQNPGKKPHEINALVKQHLEAQYPGKSPGDINQALKEHYEEKHPGKSHAEILAAVQAGGGQPSSAGPVATPPETKGEASSQTQKKAVTGQPQGSIMDALKGINPNNPMGGLKKFDPEAEAKRRAAAEEKMKNNPKANPSAPSGDLMGDLKKSMEARRGVIAQKESISANDKAKLDHMLNNEKKTPQQIREMMDDDFDLFEDHNLVEEELKKLGH